MSIEWSGSRLVAAALLVLGACAATAVFTSAASGMAAILVAAAAIACAVSAAYREHRRAAVRMVFRADGRILVDDIELEAARLGWQGPIAILDGRLSNRKARFLGWPDVLNAATRRELRLWSLETRTARSPAVMAP